MEDRNMDKLESAIRRVGNDVSNSFVCDSVKKKLLLAIQKDTTLTSRIHSIVSQVSMRMVQRVRIKERLLNFTSEYGKSRFYLSRYFFSHKKFWASVMMFVLVFNLFFFVDGGIPVVSAKYTVLEKVSGAVSIRRNGLTFVAEENFVLVQGDVVRTEDRSRAVIRFFDNSISRLRENTEVVLSRLFDDSESDDANVEIGLRDGEVWSFVNEVPSQPSDFVVRSSGIIAEAKPNSSFNVSADSRSGNSEVEVFEEVVDVQVVGDDPSLRESISKGSTAKVSFESPQIEVEDIDDTDSWIAENLGEDLNYVEGSIKDEAGVLPESVLHPVKRIKEDAKLFLTFDDVQREKIKLEIAEKRLLEAEVLASDRGGENLSKLLDEFTAAADAFAANILFLEESDPVKYVDLIVYLNGKLNRHRRNLNFVQSEVDENVDVEIERNAPPGLNIYLEDPELEIE